MVPRTCEVELSSLGISVRPGDDDDSGGVAVGIPEVDQDRYTMLTKRCMTSCSLFWLFYDLGGRKRLAWPGRISLA